MDEAAEILDYLKQGGKVLKSGYVDKQAVDSRKWDWRWKKRWLELHPHAVVWYKEPNTTPKGYLLLGPNATAKPEKGNALTLTAGSGRALFFRGKSAQEQQEWLSQTIAAIDRLGRESQASAGPSSLPTREFSQSVADPTNADGSGDLVNPTPRRKVSKTRRAVVQAMDDMADPSYTPPTVPKSPEAMERIYNGINKNALLSHLSSSQKETIVNGFIEVPTQTGDAVINQGEYGNHFYMVDSGRFNVFLAQAGEQPVLTYRVGDSFGELALLYNSPRAATVLCEEDGAVWALERKAFRYVMQQMGNQAALTAESFLKTVPMLSPLTDEQLSALAAKMEEVSCVDGEYVVEMGAKADALFFVKEGELACHTGHAAAEADKIRLKQGTVFGESCLEDNPKEATRKANVVAVGRCKVLKLRRATFLEQLGNLTEIVATNFKRKVLEGMIIDGTPIFGKLSGEEQDKLVASLVETHYGDEQRVIRQGAANDTFYVIKAGHVRVLAGPEEREVAALSSGQFFGERALLKDEAANATIVASGELTCYTCDRKTFTAVLGPLQELIDKEVARRERMSVAAKQPPPAWKDLEVRRLLGCGTFGRVRLVLHGATRNSYALKGMRKEQIITMKQQTNILNEKKILVMMDHPFILKLVACYQDSAEVYMLLELALGGELFSLLQKKAPLPDTEAMFYVAQVVAIFGFMQSQKVVYRDLKPENLLLDAQGYLKVVDFGFAKIVEDRTWTLCGTPEYLAPESIIGKGHNRAVDWWAFGILMFEMLAGQPPFCADDPMDIYQKILRNKVSYPRRVSTDARDLISKLLVSEPAQRLGSLKRGHRDVSGHPFFKPISFTALVKNELPAPYVPTIKSKTDTSNFDDYEDDNPEEWSGFNDKKLNLFLGF